MVGRPKSLKHIKMPVPDLVGEGEEDDVPLDVPIKGLYDFHYLLYPKVSRKSLATLSGQGERWVRYMEERDIETASIQTIQAYLAMFGGKLRVQIEDEEGNRYALL